MKREGLISKLIGQARGKQQEQAQTQANEEEAAQRQAAEEEARRQASEEADRRQAEEAAQRQASEEVAHRQAAEEAAKRTYVIQPGDSLSVIAQQQLGDGSRWPEIYELNKAVLGDNPNLIHPGQKITLPAR
jgi:nucleoid-associated protein YgaU